MNLLNLLLLDIAIDSSTSHFPISAVTVLIVGFVAAAGIGSIAWFNSSKVVGWKENSSEDGIVTEEKSANYDRKIISAETAARMEREKDNFKQQPQNSGDSLDTTGGYTVSREGLTNNYAVEPEMYAEVPGDMKEKQELEKQQRKEELKDINTEGGKGTGIV